MAERLGVCVVVIIGGFIFILACGLYGIATHENDVVLTKWVDVQLETLPTWSPEGLPPCEQEDSGQDYDCYWDAEIRGNGLGVSFYVIDGIFYNVIR